MRSYILISIFIIATLFCSCLDDSSSQNPLKTPTNPVTLPSEILPHQNPSKPKTTPTPKLNQPVLNKIYDYTLKMGDVRIIGVNAKSNVQLGFSFASSYPILVYVVPSSSETSKLQMRSNFNYYPTLSFTKPTKMGKKIGNVHGSFNLVLVNIGYTPAKVKIQVIVTPTSEKPLSTSTTHIISTKDIVPSSVAAVFNKFNKDGRKFYYWVEKNIKYRHDSQDPYPGQDYWQSPLETLSQRAGDCEDMAILECAFYRYFGYEAYIAAVNTQGATPDHAICIVAIDDPKKFASWLGKVNYYTINGKYYLLVDNAYSNNFGYLTTGLKQGKFIIKRIYTLEEAYLHNHAVH